MIMKARSLFLLLTTALCLPVSVLSQNITKELINEDDGFQWYKIKDDNSHCGAETVSGMAIIPLTDGNNFVSYRSDEHVFSVLKQQGNNTTQGYYSPQGRVLFPTGYYDNVGKFYNSDSYNYVIVFKDDKWGVANSNGKLIVPIEYDLIMMDEFDAFSVMFRGKKGDCYSLYNAEGSVIIPLNEQCVSLVFEPFVYGYTFQKGQYHGVLNRNGSELIPISREYTHCFLDKKGFFNVLKDGKHGICDLEGKELIKPKYDYSLVYDEDKGFFCFDPDTYDRKYIGKKLPKSIIKLANERREAEAIREYYASHKTLKTDLEKLFKEAYEMPDERAQAKVDLYTEIAKQDPSNKYGFRSPALNNIGNLFYNSGDTKTAKKYYELALEADPNNSVAKDNLKGVKRERRAQRWEAWSNALTSIGEGLQAIESNQYAGESYEGYNGTDVATPSRTTTTSTGRCNECLGNGKCSGSGTSSKYHCHGSGKCFACHGKGYVETAGHPGACEVCNSTGKCKYCGGTGRCKKCGGTGKI